KIRRWQPSPGCFSLRCPLLEANEPPSHESSFPSPMSLEWPKSIPRATVRQFLQLLLDEEQALYPLQSHACVHVDVVRSRRRRRGYTQERRPPPVQLLPSA